MRWYAKAARVGLAWVGLALIIPTAAAQTAPALDLPALSDLTAFALVRTDAGAHPPVAVSVDQTADALKDFDVVFLGELHEHPANHLAEMRLFEAIQKRAPNTALSMEQFERDVQPVIDAYLAGRIGEAALREKARAWENYPENYRPLVEYAKDHGLAVIAAEAPTDIVRCVGQEGLAFLSRLDPVHRAWVAADVHDSDGPYKDKFFGFLAGSETHGQAPAGAKTQDAQAAGLRAFAAQTTRDDTMADSIARYMRSHPGHKVVHLTGAFHAEGFLGTVERLKQRAPNLKIAIVDPVEVDDPEHPAFTPEDAAEGTFLLLLRALPADYVSDAEARAALAGQRVHFAARAACRL